MSPLAEKPTVKVENNLIHTLTVFFLTYGALKVE